MSYTAVKDNKLIPSLEIRDFLLSGLPNITKWGLYECLTNIIEIVNKIAIMSGFSFNLIIRLAIYKTKKTSYWNFCLPFNFIEQFFELVNIVIFVGIGAIIGLAACPLVINLLFIKPISSNYSRIPF